MSLQDDTHEDPVAEFEPELSTMSHETSQVSSDFSAEIASTPATTTTTTTTTTTAKTMTTTPIVDELDFSKFVPTTAPSRDFSKILIDKARARPKNFTDSAKGLSVPGSGDDISTTPIFFDSNPVFVDVNSPTTPFVDDGFTETTTQHLVNANILRFPRLHSTEASFYLNM